MPDLVATRDLARQVLALARRAGEAIQVIYNRADIRATVKSDDSPLTEADLASHEILVAGLRDLDPTAPVLSEEARALPYEERRTWKTFWLVDPLDGTKEFLKRNGEFTVNIALVHEGRAGLGVVHAPAIGRSYWATLTEGAFCSDRDGERSIRVATTTIDTPLEIVASRSHAGVETEQFLERVRESRTCRLVSIGSSLKLCLVAEGKAHLYPRFGPTMEWDTAAAQCVVEAAGGAVTDLEGKPLRYNKQDLLNPFFVAASPDVGWSRFLPQTLP